MRRDISICKYACMHAQHLPNFASYRDHFLFLHEQKPSQYLEPMSGTVLISITNTLTLLTRALQTKDYHYMVIP